MASRAEVFGNGTIRGEGTAIPHHHVIIILLAGVPQRPLDDTGGRVPRQDQGRHAEPPEVDTEIGGVKWAGGTKHLVLYDRQKLDKPRNKLTMPSRTPLGLSARPPARGWGLGHFPRRKGPSREMKPCTCSARASLRGAPRGMSSPRTASSTSCSV